MPTSSKPKNKTTKKYSQPSLYFVIAGIIIVSVFLIINSLKTSKNPENLEITYYLELDLTQFNQTKGLWLEKNPNRQKLLAIWDNYLKKNQISPPSSLFKEKISLIKALYQEPSQNQKNRANSPDIRQKIDAIIIIADISDRQKARQYLESIGAIAEISETAISRIELKAPISSVKEYYFLIKKDKLIASSNLSVLNQILAKLIKFPQKNTFKIFSSNDNFFKIYSQIDNLSIFSQILNLKTFGQDLPFWLSLKVEPEKLILNLQNNNSENQEIAPDWLNFIPKNQPNLSIISDKLSDLASNQLIIEQISRWEKLYDFSFKKDLSPLIQNNQSIFSALPKETGFSPNLTGYQYLIVVSNANSKYTDGSAQIKKIEQIAKNIFAKKYPVQELVSLPDKSKITILAAKPENFPFQTIKIGNIGLKYLKNNELEFAYAIANNKIHISNSLDLLSNQLKTTDNLQELEKNLLDCFENKKIPSNFINFFPDSVIKNQFSINQILLFNQKACIY